VDALAPLLQDGDRSVRQAAAAALGQLKDERAVAPVLTAIKNPASGAGLEIAAALGSIGRAEAERGLVRAL